MSPLKLLYCHNSIQASELAAPDLMEKVPAEIYDEYLTLIFHASSAPRLLIMILRSDFQPGPPGDAEPSAIDWVLLADDGVEPDAVKALAQSPENTYVESGQDQSHWGMTVLKILG
ncbi:uncharacterized protein MELLADRAFT_59321 [Melampsora larici-populina 98AG31]|uniref:Uncharacterized protein n=1 Tax=Melampsora larici-populina (strain 98AG31 / pathotype 3-4-7) TaxID=747676 RepID=F4R5W0_MELLP|nr:uncharacterized protein MELLADRAFT_59321 [Melampsora larici-populina 98AG31]EGG12107.1 hypothetical protein MELLADRAFT_59321 [Melampsora larici-populina 98AG31]